MYTLADAVRLKEHVLQRWEAADKDPALVGRRRAQRRRRRRRADRRRERRRPGRALPRQLRQGLSDSCRRSKARRHAGRGRPASSSRCSSRTSARTRRRRSRSAASRCCWARWSRRSRRPASRSSRAELKAHTLVWGAGLQGSPMAESLGLELGEGKPGPRRAGSQRRRTPGGVRRRRHRLDHRLEDRRALCRSWARSRCSPESMPARTSPGSSRARRPSPSNTTTRARWRRSAAGRPSCSCAADGR